MILNMIALTWLAGFTAFLGALLAKWEGSAESANKQKLVHGVVAIGGGILLSAVMFALLPEANNNLPVWAVALAFMAGGVLFCLVDQWLAKQASQASQLLAMLLGGLACLLC